MLIAAAYLALSLGAGQPALAAEDKCPDGSAPKAYTLDRKPVCPDDKSVAPSTMTADYGAFAQRTIKIGDVIYKLPDNYVFINTKCPDSDTECKAKASAFLSKYKDVQGNDYSFLNNQNWLQCLKDCPDGSASSGMDLDYCMKSPSCLKDLEKTMQAAQTEATASADPQNAADKGIAQGNREAASFLNGTDSGGTRFSMLGADLGGSKGRDKGVPSSGNDSPGSKDIPVSVRDAGGDTVFRRDPGRDAEGSRSTQRRGPGSGSFTGGTTRTSGSTDPGLEFARGGGFGSQDGQDPWLIGGIVDSSPFLKDRMFLASNSSSATDLRAMQRVGSNVLNPIAAQVMGDSTSGRTAFDGQSSLLPKDVERPKCGTNFFGSQACPK